MVVVKLVQAFPKHIWLDRKWNECVILSEYYFVVPILAVGETATVSGSDWQRKHNFSQESDLIPIHFLTLFIFMFCGCSCYCLSICYALKRGVLVQSDECDWCKLHPGFSLLSRKRRNRSCRTGHTGASGCLKQQPQTHTLLQLLVRVHDPVHRTVGHWVAGRNHLKDHLIHCWCNWPAVCGSEASSENSNIWDQPLFSKLSQ